MMTQETAIRRESRAVAILLVSILLSAQAWAHEEDDATVEAALHAMVEQRAITEAMHTVIHQMSRNGGSEALLQYIRTLAGSRQITGDTLVYLQTLLHVGITGS